MPFLTPSMESYWESCQGETIQLLKEIARIPAPSHHEEKRADFVKAWLEAQGARGVYLDDALNVVFPMNCDGKDDLRVFMAHTDVVFPDTKELPLSEADGKIFCPGVGDDTANLTILLMTIRYILKNGLTPSGGIVFAANSCEEGLGNLKGCRKLMETYRGRVKEVVSLDGGYDDICARAVGSARYRVTVRTEGGHSYGDFGHRSAVRYLASMIDTLYSIQVPEKGKTTYNVGIISGGTSVNTIAQEASMLYEYRSDEKESMDQMERAFRGVVAAYCAMGLEVETELVGLRPCMGPVDPAAEEDLLNRCRHSIWEATGEESEIPLVSGSTDCNIPLSMGIPAATLGCYVGNGAHTREEWIETQSLIIGGKVAFGLILPWFA
ncbi:MAG: M20/M25/M40 family metallo-hydrolase [Oscillospiraceae bacterium]|nr:M20/M25/M40 family metallo-hydrolase [Oscillospiraceae bacterium]